MSLHRNDNGSLPAFAWPGAYPLYYLCADSGILCPGCANRENGSEASEDSDDEQWRLVACETHWEGKPLTCDHCGAEIESAYGDPEDEEPQDDDYTTEDFTTFYVNGKLALTVSEDEDWKIAVKRRMDSEGYWPNVWRISDHGDVELLSL